MNNMTISKYLAIMFLTIALTAAVSCILCDKLTKEKTIVRLKTEAQIKTEDSFDHPEVVVENTPKGKLWRAVVYPHYHYVYWFDNSSNTVTINYQTGHNHNTVVLEKQ